MKEQHYSTCEHISWNYIGIEHLLDAFRDLVPCAQFKKREKRSWTSVTFSKVAGFTKRNTDSRMFFTFLKLDKWQKIAQSVSSSNPEVFCVRVSF